MKNAARKIAAELEDIQKRTLDDGPLDSLFKEEDKEETM